MRGILSQSAGTALLPECLLFRLSGHPAGRVEKWTTFNFTIFFFPAF